MLQFRSLVGRTMGAANHSKNSAMEAANHVKHGTSSKSLMIRGKFSTIKKGLMLLVFAALVATDAFAQTWQQKGWGRWEFSVRVQQYSRSDGKLTKDHGVQKWIGIAPNMAEAKKNVIRSNENRYWTGQNSQYGTPKFTVVGLKTLDRPNENAYKEYLNSVGEILDALGKSADCLKAIADLKHLKKISSKIGVVGKAVQAMDLVNDLLKFESYINRYKAATTQAAKDKVIEELVELGAKQLQTITTIAVPAMAWVDLANVAIGNVFDIYMDSEYDKALKNPAKAAKKAEYDKQSWALKPNNARYRLETLAYMNGMPRADIENIRKMTAVSKVVIKTIATVYPGGKFLYDWFLKAWEERGVL